MNGDIWYENTALETLTNAKEYYCFPFTCFYPICLARTLVPCPGNRKPQSVEASQSECWFCSFKSHDAWIRASTCVVSGEADCRWPCGSHWLRYGSTGVLSMTNELHSYPSASRMLLLDRILIIGLRKERTSRGWSAFSSSNMSNLNYTRDFSNTWLTIDVIPARGRKAARGRQKFSWQCTSCLRWLFRKKRRIEDLHLAFRYS